VRSINDFNVTRLDVFKGADDDLFQVGCIHSSAMLKVEGVEVGAGLCLILVDTL
jgi:hypothetical protein